MRARSASSPRSNRRRSPSKSRSRSRDRSLSRRRSPSLSRRRSPSFKKGGRKRKLAKDNDDAKIYVGGLPYDSTNEMLRSNFESFGRLKDCIVITDRVSGKSRGFGYVTFDDKETVDKVLSAQEVLVDGKKVTVKKAVAEQDMQQDSTYYSNNKIFVGGLPASCDLEMMKDFFNKFGPVQDAVVMVDHQTQRTRGFGYVTFKHAESVGKALDDYDGNKIDGKWVEVKRCIPQDRMGKNDRPRRDSHDDRGRGDNSRSYGSSYPPPNGYPGGYPGGYGGYPGMPPPGYGYPGYPGYPGSYPMYPYGYGYPMYGYGYGPPGSEGYPPYGAYGSPPPAAIVDISPSPSRKDKKSSKNSKKKKRKGSSTSRSPSPSPSPSL
eukprot:gnl/MRDRNA2_/MRDRNA2_97453_c0_seq1.p1 gnl/MRDRNA2_/MRDRNA2_97453_c0~~gnl/MRDRNA2_/MRDRNA2_97453_c0_seq1.p1  ORF type:complete len:377 (+),score=57.59 gnl/MRDRNA2_/MRDRNA2_97453_c0_seq1:52-1182(+)